MSINFNIGKGNKTVVADEEEKEIEGDEDDDDDDIKNINNNSSGLSGRLIKIALIIIVFLILLFVVLYLSSLVNSKKNFSYEQVEEVLKNAAISYFEEQPEKLPKNEKQVMKVEDSVLVNAGKMKDLSSYVNKGTACSGYVEVRLRSKDYIYTPYLNCGDSYTSTKLSTALTKKVVSSGYGLYKMDGEYVFRGEKVNNYVQLDNALWQVVKINSNGNVMLIRNGESYYTAPWDNRYNVTEKYNVGINNFNSSRIKESLQGLYNDDPAIEKDPILSSNDKAKLVSFDLCIAKRSMDSVANYNSIECGEKVDNVKVGLLTVSDYIRASIDGNCKSPDSKSCQNYNYLNSKFEYWLVTADSADSFHAYSISINGVIKSSYTNDYASIRPVIQLNSNTMISGGSGTLEDPYLVK